MRTSLNLMTEEAQRSILYCEAKRFWSRVLGGTLVGLGLLGVVEWWQSSESMRLVDMLQVQYDPVQTLKDECIAMQTEIKTLNEAQQLTLSFVDTQPTATFLATVSAAAAETNGEIYLEGLELEQPRPGKSHTRRVATLQGAGQSNAGIARFAAALRDSELFEEVTLNSSNSSSDHSGLARSFRLECKL